MYHSVKVTQETNSQRLNYTCYRTYSSNQLQFASLDPDGTLKIDLPWYNVLDTSIANALYAIFRIIWTKAPDHRSKQYEWTYEGQTTYSKGSIVISDRKLIGGEPTKRNLDRAYSAALRARYRPLKEHMRALFAMGVLTSKNSWRIAGTPSATVYVMYSEDPKKLLQDLEDSNVDAYVYMRVRFWRYYSFDTADPERVKTIVDKVFNAAHETFATAFGAVTYT